MESSFPRALKLVLKHEGGFVNHKADPGGATNKGITLGTFRRYVKKNGTVADLKAITDEQVAKVYRKHYWDAVKGDRLPSGVDYALFDYAVNSGPSRAVKTLQSIILVPQDGIIGPQTLAALSRAKPEHVIEVLCAERMKFLKGLKTWGTFGKGWTNRVTAVERDALAMVAVHETPVFDSQTPLPSTEASQPIDPTILMPDHKLSIWARIGAAILKFIINLFPGRK